MSLPVSKKSKGSLEVICGPMFSGKSEELIRRLRRATIARQSVIAFKHALDKDRADFDLIASHNGTTLYAIPTDSLTEMNNVIQTQNYTVVGIDEIQFFSKEIISLICSLIDLGKKVIVAGLDLDFRGVPFGPMATLLAIADDITKLRAICTECGYDAHFTQRLVNSLPATYNDPLIQIGAQEAYQARCRSCYSIDQKPQL